MEFGISKDEIKQYLDVRYVSAHEACWRMLERELHTQVPAVMALTVHEKDHQNVTFNPNTRDAIILNRAERAKTTLMGYFERNRIVQNVHHLLSVEFPEQYTWKEDIEEKWEVC